MSQTTSIELYKFYYILKRGRPIWTVFLLYLTITKQITIFQAMLLTTFSSITSSIIEVPSGYIAEIIGYKKIILIGEIISLVGFIIIYCSNNFYILVVAYILGGFGDAFISGTDEALIYSYFKLTGRDNDFKTFISELFSKSEFVAACITLSAGYLFSVNNSLPMLISIIIMVLEVTLVFLLNEIPKEERTEVETTNKKSLKELAIISPALWRTISFYVIFFLTVTNINYTVTTYVKTQYFHIKYIGVLLFVLKIATSIGAWMNKRYKLSLVKAYGIYYILIIMISFSNNLYLSVTILLLLRLFNGIIFPSFRTNINEQIRENRAYVLSIQSLIVSISSAVFDPFFGKTVDLWGYSTAFRTMVVMVIIVSSYYIVIGNKKATQKQDI